MWRSQGFLSLLVGTLWNAHSSVMTITSRRRRSGATAANAPVRTHADNEDNGNINSKLNWLRAAVLGANDGIVSTAGIVMGVAGATAERSQLLIAGLAGLVAGALSMAGGEYVSVSSQRDIEKALMTKEAGELRDFPDEELEELVGIYTEKGLSRETARQVALELTDHDPLRAHADAELGIDPDEYTNPWHAAFASMAAFTVGAIIPLLAMVCFPGSVRVPITIIATIIGLFLTGLGSGVASGGSKWRPIVRNIVVGICSMTITYVIGHIVGTRV